MALRTEDEARQDLADSIETIDPSVDVRKGPYRRNIINPVGSEISGTEQEVQHLSRLYSTQFKNEFSEEEMDSFGLNYGIERSTGQPSVGFVTFFTPQRPQPSTEIPIPSGTVVSTADGNLNYQTTEEGVIDGDFADNFFNAQTRQYEITIPIEALASGEDHDVPALRVNTIQTGVDNIAGVENRTTIEGGSSIETNEDYGDRIQAKIDGTEKGSVGGLESEITNFDPSRIKDVSLVYSSEIDLFTRRVFRPAIDAYVVGSNNTLTTDTFVASGGETDFVLTKQPVTSIVDVRLNGTSITTYELIEDDSEYSDSVQGSDKIVLDTPAGVGDTIEVDYYYNKLLTDIDENIAQATQLFDTNILTRASVRIPIECQMTITILSSFSQEDVETQATEITTEYLSPQKLESTLNPSELRQQLEANVAGVSNILISKFTRADRETLPVQVITMNKTEESFTDDSLLTISVRR